MRNTNLQFVRSYRADTRTLTLFDSVSGVVDSIFFSNDRFKSYVVHSKEAIKKFPYFFIKVINTIKLIKKSLI